MTKEEKAKKYLIDISYALGNMSIEYLTEKDGEKMREAIKTLERESCEDAISRQTVLDLCDSKDPEYKVEHLKEDVECLPPVTPQPKTGHWYRKHSWEICFTCSECGTTNASGTKYNYCPSCGCHMVEPQESDHKCHTCKHYTSGEYDGSCGSYICKHYSNWEGEG